MNNAWKALASVAVAAALVITPLVTVGAAAQEAEGAVAAQETEAAVAAPETEAAVVAQEAEAAVSQETEAATAQESVAAAAAEDAPAVTPAAPIVMSKCTSNGTRPTATNLASQGWSLEPGATFVDGGLSLDATGGDTWATLTLPEGTRLSDIGDLTTTFASSPGSGWGGILLRGGELTKTLHYDDDGRFWTLQPGIFQAVRAGYYQSWPINADGANVPTKTPELLSNPLIGSLTIYVNENQKVVVASQSYLCSTQAFTYKAPIVMSKCTSNGTRPTATNLASQGWSLEPGATFVDGGLSLDATGGDTWATLTLPEGTRLSDIGDLTTTFASSPGSGWGGILLRGGELTKTLHYDDDGRFWTLQPGVFQAVRAGYYQSWPINADGANVPTKTPELLSNPLIGSLTIYVNENQKVVVASQSYLCSTQAFNFATETVTTPGDPTDTDPTDTDPTDTDPTVSDPTVSDPTVSDPAPATAASTGSLASTGGPDMAPWGIGAAALVLAGAALMALRKAVRA